MYCRRSLLFLPLFCCCCCCYFFHILAHIFRSLLIVVLLLKIWFYLSHVIRLYERLRAGVSQSCSFSLLPWRAVWFDFASLFYTLNPFRVLLSFGFSYRFIDINECFLYVCFFFLLLDLFTGHSTCSDISFSCFIYCLVMYRELHAFSFRLVVFIL